MRRKPWRRSALAVVRFADSMGDDLAIVRYQEKRDGG